MTTANQDGRPSRWLGPGLAFPASLVVLVIILVPILQLARYSFNHFDPADLMQTAFTFENYAKFFGDPYYRDIFFTTLWVAGYAPCWRWCWAFRWRTSWRARKAGTRACS